MTLFYNNGKSSYTIERLLDPDEQIWADVGELIRDQIPDKDGKIIPPDTMMGSYELRDLDHRGVGQLYEGKLVLDKTSGHGYYGCASCCGYTAAALWVNPYSGAINTGGYTVTRTNLTTTSATGSPANLAGNPAFSYSVSGSGNVVPYRTSNRNANPHSAAIGGVTNNRGRMSGSLDTGIAACSGFQNNIVIGACNPPVGTCPGQSIQ